MQSYGRGWVVPNATQNHQVYNARRYLQNQQGTMYMNYMPYTSNPLHLQQEPMGYMTCTPYPQYSSYPQHMTCAPYPFYSQQEIKSHLLQDPMANDMVFHDQQDQNGLFQNYFRKKTTPEYKSGEMVMVRFNQQKWLNGVIQSMSAQGMQIWVFDANMLVNVPLVLLPTCVLKMSTYSTLEFCKRIEPMWTITNHGGYQKMLRQCVRPTHLPHCQIFYVLDNNMCVICKLRASNIINMVSPWNCCHQVHNCCLQLQMQQCSTIICPSCNANFPHQLNLSKYSSLAHPSLNNGHPQQFDLQCVCGFKSVMIGNINAAIFCPNCHQLLNENSMTTNMESGQAQNNMNTNPMMFRIQNKELTTNMNLNPRMKPMQSEETPINIDLFCDFSKLEKEILESSTSSKIPTRERFFNDQNFRFGWPMQSFNGLNRLEAIEEDLDLNTSSLESATIEARCRTPSSFLSHLQVLDGAFENNNISYQNVVAMKSANQDVQLPSYFQNSLQDSSLSVPYHIPTTIQSQQPNFEVLLQDGSINVSPFSPTTPIQKEQHNSQSSLQNNFKDAPSFTPITIFQNELWKDNAFNIKQLATSSSRDAFVMCENIIEVEEASKSINQPKIDKMTITTIEGHKSWNETKPNTNIAAIEDQSLEKKVSQTIISIVENEDSQIWEKSNEVNTKYETIEDCKLKKKVSEKVNNFGPKEGQKLGDKTSEPNTTIEDINVQKLWKKTSEPNARITTSKDQRSEKMSETITTIATSVGQKLEQRANESNSIYSTAQNKKLWEKENKLNRVIASSERPTLWKRMNIIDGKKNLEDDKESEKIEKKDFSNDFVASSSSVAPMCINHFNEATKEKKLWKRASVIDWSKVVSDDEIKDSEVGSKETNSSMDPNVAPMYVDHFANFVKLAMGANSPIAKDILANASTSTSSSIPNSLLPLESITHVRISPSPTFFTKASSLFTKAPEWIIHSKNSDEATSTSPTWITVIKDGIDSRKDDKQWE